MNKENEIKYLTFGSPLMDMIVDVDSDFINRNSLKLDTTIHVESTSHSVFREIKNISTQYLAGGCSYNAIRVLNWMLDRDEKCTVACLGSVGDDEEGIKYQKLLIEESIVPIFETFKDGITGKCAVLCSDRNRCHLTDLGASTLISEKFIKDNWDKIKNVSLVYTELYILQSRASIVFQLAELCLDNDKIFGFNLPAEFFLDKFSDSILDIISYGDVVFSNKEEARFLLTEVLKQELVNESDIAVALAKLPKKNKNKKRVFVVTCGPEPAYVAVYDHLTEKIEYKGTFEPLFIEKSKIVDTNGAGDSFAGGFLAYFMNRAKIEVCMNAGHYAASQIIQERGCVIRKDKKPDLSKFIGEVTKDC
jgi:adenosine kinase